MFACVFCFCLRVGPPSFLPSFLLRDTSPVILMLTEIQTMRLPPPNQPSPMEKTSLVMLPTNEGTRDVCGLLFPVLVETDQGEPLFAGKERKERNHPWSAAAVPRKRWFLKSPRLFCVFWGNGRIFEQVKQKPPCEILLAAAVVIGPSPLSKQIFSGGSRV